jgi:hypothetical protein
MNKRIKKELQPKIDAAWTECKARIALMQPERENPQIALMLEKNKGYLMALEDITAMLYSAKVF